MEGSSRNKCKEYIYMCVCVCVCEKLFDEIKMLQVNFIVIYIIHEMLVLLKITRILKRFLRSIIDFYF